MPNPYAAVWESVSGQWVRLDGQIYFTDPSNQPGGGGGGSVDSVTAGDSSIAIGGTAADPTVAVAAQGVTQAKIADGAVTDVQVNAANKDGLAAVYSMRTLGTGGQQAVAGNDSRLSDARTPTGAAGGDLAGTYPSPTLAPFGGGAVGPIGDATHVAVVTVDAKGRVSAVSSVAISGVAPAGAAGGDLSGTYPSPTVAKLNGVAINNAPALGQVLTAVDATHAQWAASSGGGWTTVTAASDQSIASSTTQTDDAELFFTSVSGATYEIEFAIAYGSPAGAGTPNFKTGIGEDTTSRGVYFAFGRSPSGLATQANALVNLSGTAAWGTAANDRVLKIYAGLEANGGTFKLQWAQNTSSVNATIRRAGSQLRYRRIS